MAKAESYYKIGLVMKPHGLKGDVTISIDADAPDFSETTPVFLDIDHRYVPFFIESISLRGEKAFVKFEDVSSVEAAKKISKHTIYLPKSSRPKSGKGEFYDDEIVGFDVIDETLGPLGKTTGIIQTGLNKLFVVAHAQKEILIPVNSPLVVGVHKSTKTINVNLPEGFLEI